MTLKNTLASLAGEFQDVCWPEELLVIASHTYFSGETGIAFSATKGLTTPDILRMLARCQQKLLAEDVA